MYVNRRLSPAFLATNTPLTGEAKPETELPLPPNQQDIPNCSMPVTVLNLRDSQPSFPALFGEAPKFVRETLVGTPAKVPRSLIPFTEVKFTVTVGIASHYLTRSGVYPTIVTLCPKYVPVAEFRYVA